MKQRFGGVLCLVAGAVLIFGGGFGGGSDATAGGTVPCGGGEAGIVIGCPTGTITVTEVTDTSDDPGASVPSGWEVTVSSTNGCNLPSSGTTQTIGDGGTASFDGLFAYRDENDTSTVCEYSLDESAVAGFSASFDPPPPYTFDAELGGGGGNSDVVRPNVLVPLVTVTLTNTAAAATTSAAPSQTVEPSSSGPSTDAGSSDTVTAAPVDASQAGGGGTLANTGPRHQVRGSLIVGIVLCMLGSVLLFAGRRPRTGTHTP